MAKQTQQKERGIGYIPSPKVYDFIESMEGDLPAQQKLGTFRRGKFYVYRDAASHTTIGYGHKLTRQDIASGRFMDGITQDQADSLLREDVRGASKIAAEHFGKDGWADMSQEQKDAAIDHTYNLGAAGLKKFPRWSQALRNGDWETVRKEAKRHYKNSATNKWSELSLRNAAYESVFVQPNLMGSPDSGSTQMAQADVPSILEKNADKNFVKRILEPDKYPKLSRGKDAEGNEVHSTHSMAWSSNEEGTKHYVYPTVVQREGQEELEDLGEYSPDYARATGEFIEFDSAEEADDFSKNYKKVWEKPGLSKHFERVSKLKEERVKTSDPYESLFTQKKGLFNK